METVSKKGGLAMCKPLKTLDTRPNAAGVERLRCPSCGGSVLTHLLPDTEARSVGLFCGRCRMVNVLDITPVKGGHTVELLRREWVEKTGQKRRE